MSYIFRGFALADQDARSSDDDMQIENEATPRPSKMHLPLPPIPVEDEAARHNIESGGSTLTDMTEAQDRYGSSREGDEHGSGVMLEDTEKSSELESNDEPGSTDFKHGLIPLMEHPHGQLLTLEVRVRHITRLCSNSNYIKERIYAIDKDVKQRWVCSPT